MKSATHDRLLSNRSLTATDTKKLYKEIIADNVTGVKSIIDIYPYAVYAKVNG